MFGPVVKPRMKKWGDKNLHSSIYITCIQFEINSLLLLGWSYWKVDDWLLPFNMHKITLERRIAKKHDQHPTHQTYPAGLCTYTKPSVWTEPFGTTTVRPETTLCNICSSTSNSLWIHYCPGYDWINKLAPLHICRVHCTYVNRTFCTY